MSTNTPRYNEENQQPDRSADVEDHPNGTPSSTNEYVPAVHRPTTISSIASVLLGFVAITRLVPFSATSVSIVLTAIGIGLVTTGVLAATRGNRVAGGVAVLVGVVGLVGALGIAVSHPDEVVSLTLVPALLGIIVLSTAVIPIRGSGSRARVRIGCGLLLLALLVVGAIGEAPVGELGIAFVAIVIAWDSADNAIGLGRQIGRNARSRRAELVHSIGTITAGLIGIGITRVVTTVGAASLDLSDVFLLLLATVIFVIALSIDQLRSDGSSSSAD